MDDESCFARNTLGRFEKNCTAGLAFQNQILLTIFRQDPNQLFKGVLLSAANAADLTPRSGDYGELACAFC
ncbi:hypothetical protein [Bradyrhizobium sp. McL0616]|uniref:hypothetical protein n=1 Tax=Bradyrhizobium sp. McL0616 TaxID=3415674 RepID=UPI003CF5157D